VSDLSFYPLRRQLKGSFILLPEFIQRIQQFEEREPSWCRDMARRFEDSFCRDDNLMLGVAIVTPEGKMVGHVLAGIESVMNQVAAMVYQFHKDKGNDNAFAETNGELECMVEGWAVALITERKLPIQYIVCAVKDEKRERLFAAVGYEPGPRLMRRKIGG
jgi:hypothetical protein